MEDNVCKMFEAIEKDPLAKCGWTVRDYLIARMHINLCKKCSDIVDRVTSKYPDKDSNNTINVSLN